MASDWVPSSSDAIWNRAASTEPLPPHARIGDRALRDVLEIHGYVMNGGLDHALDVMGHDAARAAAAWEYFGRPDMAELLRRALRVVPDMPSDRASRQRFFIDGWKGAQEEAIQDLAAGYEEDEGLEQAFLRRLSEHPEDFAPIDD